MSALSTGSALAAGIPVHPTALATDNEIALDGLIAIGLKPACATSPIASFLAPYANGVQSLGAGGVAGTDFNVEALAACHPDGIVAPSYDDGASGSYYDQAAAAEQTIAPTIFFEEPNPPVSSAGIVQSTWRNWFAAYADQLGYKQQANEVIANLDRVAAPIRGQVAGKTLALISLTSSSAWESANDYLPITTVYIEDLGLNNLQMPSSDYAGDCETSTPMTCYTNPLSTEDLTQLDSADAVLVQSPSTNASDNQTFEQNPLYQNLPAVKTGHVGAAESFIDIGPIGVGFEYQEVAHAFGLKEYNATVTGGNGATADFTLNTTRRKLCWAVEPTRGKSRSHLPIEMLSGSGKSARSLALTAKPRYISPEPSEYRTSPITYETTGCATAPKSFSRLLAKSPAKIKLSYGNASGKLVSGQPSVVLSSSQS